MISFCFNTNQVIYVVHHYFLLFIPLLVLPRVASIATTSDGGTRSPTTTVTINSRVAGADKVDTSEHRSTRITSHSRYG